MNTSEAAVAALAMGVMASEISCSVRDNQLLFDNLPLRVQVNGAEVYQGAGACAVTVMYSAAILGVGTPINVLAVGLGGNPADALNDAAMQWALGVIPVLVSSLIPAYRECLVEKRSLIVTDPKDGKQHGWTVYCGPVIGRSPVAGPVGASAPGLQASFFDTIAVRARADLVPGSIAWIECYAARQPDGKADATCRLNNTDWNVGKDLLQGIARRYPVGPGSLVSQRQFLFFQPAPVVPLKFDDSANKVPLTPSNPDPH